MWKRSCLHYRQKKDIFIGRLARLSKYCKVYLSILKPVIHGGFLRHKSHGGQSAIGWRAAALACQPMACHTIYAAHQQKAVNNRLNCRHAACCWNCLLSAVSSGWWCWTNELWSECLLLCPRVLKQEEQRGGTGKRWRKAIQSGTNLQYYYLNFILNFSFYRYLFT